MCVCIFVFWFLCASIFLSRSTSNTNSILILSALVVAIAPHAIAAIMYLWIVEWWKCVTLSKCRNALCMHCCSFELCLCVFWLDIVQPQCGSAMQERALACSRKKNLYKMIWNYFRLVVPTSLSFELFWHRITLIFKITRNSVVTHHRQ